MYDILREYNSLRYKIAMKKDSLFPVGKEWDKNPYFIICMGRWCRGCGKQD